MMKKTKYSIVFGKLLLCLTFFSCDSTKPFFDEINRTDRNIQKHGIWIDKEVSSGRTTIITYKHGKKHGVFTEYHEKGTLSISGKYKNDLKEGVWKFFTDKGILSSRAKYKSGKLIENQISNLDWFSSEDKSQKHDKNKAGFD